MNGMSNRSFRGIRTIRFGDFEFDVHVGELLREGARVRLQEQPLRILTALLEHPGDVVSREDIRKRLWPNGTVVEVSHGINAAVQRLREALGESAENPRFVETLARRGYRFVAPVQVSMRAAASASASEPPPPADVSHFRVLEPLGAGGMGVVYRAEDRKLGRSVALKFLPARLAQDDAALARFRREAQTASALNHPNICTVYGVEECAGQPVIVMEYVQGESLEAMLLRGPVPQETALRLAIQMAGALDAAHRAGIVHRDFKPANVLVTAAGVKVLDFGLAKMDHPPALGFEPPHVTHEGAILGTLHYLSPEQAQGSPAEPSSDIFSFGAVLYEMLTGRRAFDGPNPAHVMAAIIALDPPAATAAIPRSLDRVLRRCLAKQPRDRWQSASELKSALEEVSIARQPRMRKVAWVVGAAAAAVAIAGIAMAYAGYHDRNEVALDKKAAAPAVRIEKPVGVLPVVNTAAAPVIVPDLSRTAAVSLTGGSIMRIGLSPDNKRIAYIADGHLWVSGVNGESPQTYGAADGTPFWSPDGRWVAASSRGRLWRFNIATRASFDICMVDTSFSGAWSRAGVILIGGRRDGLFRVPAEGGVPIRVTTPDAAAGETRHIAVQFLPDGRRFLYVAGAKTRGQSKLYVASLDSADRQLIMPVSSTVQYVGGYLLYAVEGMLAAQAFDEKQLRVTGERIVLSAEPASEMAANAAIDVIRFSATPKTLALPAIGKASDRITLISNWKRH